MNRYAIGSVLGEGAFGTVSRAVHIKTNTNVAIKTLKRKCKHTESMMAMPEVKALKDLTHEHIVACKEVIRDRHNLVHLVFELLPGGNLEALTRKRTTPLTDVQIRTILHQLLLGVHHIHARNYLHRDLKPENILLRSNDIDDIAHIHIKVADLGLAKCISRANSRPLTSYISTRWYRSPEILLGFPDYSFPSDLWAVGAVISELVAHGKPLLPGDDDVDQLRRIIALRGHPQNVGWRRGAKLLRLRGVVFPVCTTPTLASALPRASAPVLQLLSDLLRLDPDKRPTAAQALAYPLFMPRLMEMPDATAPARALLSARGLRRRYEGDGGGQPAGDVGDSARTSDMPSGQWSGDSEGIGAHKGVIAMPVDCPDTAARPQASNSNAGAASVNGRLADVYAARRCTPPAPPPLTLSPPLLPLLPSPPPSMAGSGRGGVHHGQKRTYGQWDAEDEASVCARKRMRTELDDDRLEEGHMFSTRTEGSQEVAPYETDVNDGVRMLRSPAGHFNMRVQSQS